MRSDLPAQLFEQLLATASKKVRSKLHTEYEFAKADIKDKSRRPPRRSR